MKIFNRWKISRLQTATTGDVNSEVASITASWFDVFLALLGVAGDIVDLGVDYARTAFQKLVTALIVIIGLIAWGFVLNVNEYYSVNIILASFFAIITAILWWRPKQVEWVIIAGALIGELNKHDKERGGLSNGAKWLIEEYLNIFKIVALVGTVSLFYLGFVPFGANPIAFFVLIGGSIAASLLADRYKEQLHGTFAVEFLYYGIVVIVTLSALSLLPQKSWGDEHSFMYALAGNIKDGAVVFTLLATLIATLSRRRMNIKKGEAKGFPWMIFFFVGLLDIMFMPMDHLVKYIPFMSHGPNVATVMPHKMVTQALPPQTFHLVSGGNFQKADVPPGVVIEKITWDCPQGCVVHIEHDGSPMCVTGNYPMSQGSNGIQCASIVVAKNRDNTLRYREEFIEPAGVNIDYPKDLVRSIYTFGTDDIFGQVDVTVKTVISK